LGSILQKKIRKKAMISTLISNSTIKAKEPNMTKALSRCNISLIRKLDSTIMQILIKVPAINKVVKTSFDSSRRSTILLDAGCCFVFSILISLLFSENNATSAPEITNERIIKANRRIINIVVPCVLIEIRKYSKGCHELLMTE
jgi:L-lactate permease